MRKKARPDKNKVYQDFVVKRLRIQDIAKKYGFCAAMMGQIIKEYGFRDLVTLDYKDKTFGHVTVIKRCGRDKFGHHQWVCKCDCGNNITLPGYRLKIGDTKTCGNCGRSRKKGKDHKNFKGYEEISSTHWNSIRKGARDRDIELSITIKQAWKLYIQQDKKCALSGLEISFQKERNSIKKTTASLDRIDNTKGYTINNVQWVHKRINWMKNTLTQDEFIEFCGHVTNFNKVKR